MAKVSNKTSYLRGLVTRQITRMEKRGYTIPEELKQNIKNAKYQTLKSLRDRGYGKLYEQAKFKKDGQEVSGKKGRILERKAATEKAKRTVAEKKKEREYRDRFKDIEGQFDPETGEIFESYYQSQGKQQGQGAMSQEDTFDNIYEVIEDFINKISQPVPDYFFDSYGRRHYYPESAREQIERATEHLRQLVQREIASGNAQALAQRLEDNAEEIGTALERLYGYDERSVNSAMITIANIISSHVLSMSDLSDLTAAKDYSDGYEEP